MALSYSSGGRNAQVSYSNGIPVLDYGKSVYSQSERSDGLLDVAQLINMIQSSTANNAYTAALEAARETNSFNAQQAAINRQFQQTSAERAMQFEREMSQQSMDFSERMSNTLYQRGVEDLKAAGLSPLLAYSNLQTSAPSGVSAAGHSASGSSASGVKADVPSALQVERKREDQLYNAIALNINSALALKRLEKEWAEVQNARDRNRTYKEQVAAKAVNDNVNSAISLFKILD